ncbi:MAG: DNA repair protein RecO [Crocinitomicaceae bacterium]|nr:DNA repair protein RecO [Crocinitomicaceae bacterium]
MKSTDEGIFLQRTPYSDSSLITTFYTQKGGLQKFIFKGGKKKAHNIYPLSISELTYYGRKESDLLNLTQVESSKALTFQFNPIKGAVAFFMAETINKCVHQGDVDEVFYQFIKKSIEHLDTTDELGLFPVQFLIECCDNLGFAPLCEIPEAGVFNLDSGIFQMTSSIAERSYSGPSVILIRSLLNGQSPKENPNKQEREEALEIMLEYFRIHIPRFETLDSYDIVKEVLGA